MQQDWEALDLGAAFETGVAGERAVGVAYFAYMRSLGPRERSASLGFGKAPGSQTAEGSFNQLVVMPIWAANSETDEAYYLRQMQNILDSFRQLQQVTPGPGASQQLGTTMKGFDVDAVLTNRMTLWRHLVSFILMPNYVRVRTMCLRHETQRRFTITALALKRYRLRHGKFPTELDALVPQFLSAVPMDLMSAKPLRYRLNGDGSFTLYSVGKNGRDDGGDSTSTIAPLLYGECEDKDHFWPAAVK